MSANRWWVTEKPGMHTWLFILFLCSLAITSAAQSSIKGIVTDGEHPLPGATVLVLQAHDSVLVKGMVSSNAGQFVFDNIESGTYTIHVSMIGYARYRSNDIVLENQDVTLSGIHLSEETTKLGEVIIRAEKPLFEQQADRIVINVQSSVTSSGNSVLEVLQKSPGVLVNPQGSGISVNGKSGVRVMINGKVTQLPSDVVVQMLSGMSASNVDRIEIITAPSSKYDAEGNAGIIHIITKENAEYGTNGSIGLTAGYKWAETVGGNFNINHRTAKLAFYADYSFVRTHNLHTMDLEKRTSVPGFTQSVVNHSHRKNITHQHNINTGVEWRFSKNLLLDVLVTGYSRDWELNALTNDISRVSPDSTVLTEMNIHESNVWQSATASIGLQSTFNEKSELSVYVDYLYYRNKNPSFYDNIANYQPGDGFGSSMIDLDKDTPIRTLVAKADYRFAASPSFTIETGGKGVTSALTNDVLVRTMINGEWMIDPVFTSYSNLREVIGAAYIATTWHAAGHWQINTGLRYEYTHTSIGTPQQQNLIDRKYGYLFPGLSLKRNLAKEVDLQFSYSRRITRPTYNDIAPFVFFWSPNIFSAGNTSLWPALSDAVRLEYHNRQWSANLQYNHTRKEIINLFQPENDTQSNSLIFRSQNLAYLNTLSLSNMWSFNVCPWWDIQSTITLQHQEGRTEHLTQNISLDLWSLNMNATNIIKLPKDITIEVSGFYQSKSIYGISEFLPYGSLNAGVQKKFGEKGTLKLSMDDILYTNVWRIATNRPTENLTSNIRYDWHNQYIRLTYSRNIGNDGLRSVKIKSGSTEEQRRVN
ncbi:MAG TPA: TonB-dependent receptor [Cyclobacteriaceae bacterium]|nr:TonB-dependent receptor [Cyclobacteriaceae bacterium]